MNQQEVVNTEDTSFDGFVNFLLYKDQSANFKGRTVFPTGERTKVINPNAKPLKLDPPK